MKKNKQDERAPLAAWRASRNASRCAGYTAPLSFFWSLIAFGVLSLVPCIANKCVEGLHDALDAEREEGNTEYKRQLANPSPERFEELVSQLKWRLGEGQGEAIYEIGVADDGSKISADERFSIRPEWTSPDQ